MGEKIEASYDRTVEFERYVSPLIDAAFEAAATHGIALTAFATYKRIVSESDSEGHDEQTSAVMRSHKPALHAFGFMVADAIVHLIEEDRSLLNDPEKFITSVVVATMAMQRGVKQIIRGEAEYTDPSSQTSGITKH